MEWEEKQEQYIRAWASGRTATDIYKYIPQKYAQAVTDAFADEEGYWIYLDNESGLRAYDGSDDCGTIHEYTITDLKNAVKTIRRATWK